MNNSLKKIVISIMITVGFIMLFIILFSLLKAPVFVKSNIVNGDNEIDLNKKITVNYDKNINKDRTTISLLPKNPSDYQPKIKSTFSKRTITIEYLNDYYLLPDTEYVLKIQTHSNLFNLPSKTTYINFATKKLDENETLSQSMEAQLITYDDFFEDGKRKGFSFVTNIPITTEYFIIEQAYELIDNNKVNLSVIYQNGGNSSNVMTWLKAKGTNTEEVVINQ